MIAVESLAGCIHGFGKAWSAGGSRILANTEVARCWDVEVAGTAGTNRQAETVRRDCSKSTTSIVTGFSIEGSVRSPGSRGRKLKTAIREG